MMRGPRTLIRIALTGVLAILSLVLGGGAPAVAACPDNIPTMIVKIINNSANFNIYPVISFPGAPLNATDEWMQGCFGTTWAKRDTDTYRNGTGTTRVFVNCCDTDQKGIPPLDNVIIRLPLYTPLVAGDIDPTKAGQFIEWWQGININLFRAPAQTNRLPPELLALRNAPKTEVKEVVFPAGVDKPKCMPNTPCELNFFTSAKPGISLGNPIGKDPQQLVEATLGANSANGKANRNNPNARLWFFNPKNVDYDVSYVNSAFMPVAMEPFGNNKVGWVGAPNSISDFSTKVQTFLKTPNVGEGWPLYLDGTGGNGKPVPGKIPSVLEILALDVANDPKAPNDGQWIDQKCPPRSPGGVCGTHFSPYPPTSAPIQALLKAWKNCRIKGDIDAFCTLTNSATRLLLANFDNYVANYKKNPAGWNCDLANHPDPHPIDRAHLTDLQILRHLYGWTPFNEFCGAKANLLEKTPGYTSKVKPNYQSVKDGFDRLQYWVDVLEGRYGVFHPYVALIHGPTLLNAQFTYAYSVDDAVGNVQTDGTGIILAVGGLDGLPNPDRYTPEVHVNFAYKSDSNGNTFTHYGKCTKIPTTPVNPNFSSFSVPVGVTDLVSNCVFSLKDNKGRIYLLQISPQHPPAVCPANAKCEDGDWTEWTPEISGNEDARIPVRASCTMNNNAAIRNNWCQFRFAYQRHLGDPRNTIEYHVDLGEPIP